MDIEPLGVPNVPSNKYRWNNLFVNSGPAYICRVLVNSYVHDYKLSCYFIVFVVVLLCVCVHAVLVQVAYTFLVFQ